ncbi:iron reductase domain protein [Poronia punctata]|nr:iron reductase domain protein [Poronia punctata]
MHHPLSTLLTLTLTSLITAGSTTYCDPKPTVCYSETQAPGTNLTIRLALPAVEEPPFDAILQIVAPKAEAGWAAIAWGGKMTKNPLAVSWANGNTTVISSRWADTRTPPILYPNATYTILKKGSSVNSTHWTLTALCSGFSTWTDGGELDPNDKGARFAYALSPKTPRQPGNRDSSIEKHTVHGYVDVDLAGARTEKFEEYVEALS